MGTVISFSNYKKQLKEAKEVKKAKEFQDSMARIRASIEKINAIMQETRDEHDKKGLHLRPRKS